MLEFYIVYDVATGAICFRAAVQPGYSQQAPLDEGQALLVLPAGTFRGDDVDIDMVKAALIERVDHDAETVCLRFVSPGDARAGIYQAKAAEARAFLADDTAPTPILTGEAAGRGMTVAAVAAQVAALADQWAVVAGRIEGARLGAKDGVGAATTPEEALRFGTIDWSAVLAPVAA